MKIKEINPTLACKPFKIKIEIETKEDLLWLYGISNSLTGAASEYLEGLGSSLEASQMNLFEAIEEINNNHT